MRGHIRKRGKNSWEISVYLGRDPQTGKKQYQWKSFKGTKKNADIELASMLSQVERGTFIKPTRIMVGDYLEQWLRDYVSTNVRPRTAEDYTSKIRGHIIPGLGRIPLIELQPPHLQAFYGEKQQTGRMDGKGGLSARTVLHFHRILSEALEHAVRMGIVGRNVAKLVDAPRPVRKEMLTLDVCEVHALLEASLGSVYYPVFYLAINTGLRRSELLGLRWRDIDLDMATLSVVQVLLQLSGGCCRSGYILQRRE